MKALLAILALLVVLGLGWFLYSSPTAPAEMTEAEIAEIQAEVMEAADLLITGWNTNDVELFLTMFHPNKVSHAWGSQVYDNHDELSEQWLSVWETGDSVRISWTARDVQVLTDQAAMFQGSTDLMLYYTDGRILHYPGTAHWTGLFEPSEAGWRMTTSAYTFGGAQRLDTEG